MLASALWGRAVPALGQQKDVQVIELGAKKYEYSPSTVRVKAGTTVQLKVTAVDHDHGFRIVSEGNGLAFTSPQECWLLKKGETTTIEFVAKAQGTYAFACCHFCGFGHKGMKGQIVVE